MRIAALVVCLLDLAAWIAAVTSLASGNEPATSGLDNAGAAVVTALFLVTVLPAFLLALQDRRPRTALGLALAFPATFVLLVAVVAMLLP